MKTVNFDYAFSTPHVLTLCRPAASEKVLTYTENAGIKFAWTYGSAKNDYPRAWTTHPFDSAMFLEFSVEGESAPLNRWRRHESGAPCICAKAQKNGVQIDTTIIAGKTGIIIKTEFENTADTPRRAQAQLAHISGWVVSNRGWVDGKNNNLLLSMSYGRADRMLALALGADDYLMYGVNKGDTESLPPMSNSDMGIAPHSMKKVTPYFYLEAGAKKAGYIILPYKKYFADLEAVKTTDCEKEIADALSEWVRLLGRGTQFDIPDSSVTHCYNACLADMFVMMERLGKYKMIACGTYEYRSPGAGEPMEAAIMLDTLGYTKESLACTKMHIEGQDDDGAWVSVAEWGHEMWGLSFMKSAAVLEHYKLSHDREYLEKYYPYMLRSTMWQHRARQSTKNSPQKSARGLLPRGMGDCGMMSNGDFYGIFYPWNVMSVGSDMHTLEAAEILGRAEDVSRLRDIIAEAKTDLLTSIYDNLADYGDFVMMKSAADAEISSMYGCLFPFFPTNMVGADEPIIQGAVQFIESKRMSEGGLPLGTGWQQDGLWVAMALSYIARTYLRMGLYDKAKKYLYPALNHGSPYVTYCEERGGEKGSTNTSGDLQHLWTPLSVCQYMIDAYWLDTDAIHLCCGIPDEWLTEGGGVGFKGLGTYYGKANMRLTYKDNKACLTLKTTRPMEKDIILHLPTGEVSVPAKGRTEIKYQG